MKSEITFVENYVYALESFWLVEDNYVFKPDGFQRLGTIPQEVALFWLVCVLRAQQREHAANPIALSGALRNRDARMFRFSGSAGLQPAATAALQGFAPLPRTCRVAGSSPLL